MKTQYILYTFISLCIFLSSNLLASQNDFFIKGKNLFDKKDLEKSKIYFERDIVFNPKSEKSYLYLAKIFNKNENDIQEERNLSSVLVLNPSNDEAIYMLTLLKIKQSDYDTAKELIKKFELVCVSFCGKKSEIKNKFEKIIPTNEKD